MEHLKYGTEATSWELKATLKMALAYCITHQHEEMISRLTLEVTSFHFHSVQHDGLKCLSGWKIMLVWPNIRRIIISGKHYPKVNRAA